MTSIRFFRAALVARLVILGILFSISITLTLIVVVVTKPVILHILFVISITFVFSIKISLFN